MKRILSRLAALLCAVAAFAAVPAVAQVSISFHSFNGSLLAARYPHTFVVFEGTLDSTGEKINENFGFSAKSVDPSILAGPVAHVIWVETQKHVRTTNTHFTIPISDELYFRMKAEITRWRDAPGKYYDIDKRNCIHFVGRLAEMAGLKVDYPKDLLRKPKAWLNRVGRLNPRLGAADIP